MWSTGEGNGKPHQYSCLENPMNSMKRQNDRILKYATGDQWRTNSRRNEGMEPKQKQYPAVDVTGDRSKVRCCKEQYCIGTWNVRSINQGKLEVVKQEMARVNVDILGISELKWTGMGKLLGASVRHSAHGKGHEEGGLTYAKAGSSLRSPPGNPQASTPITRACLLYYFVLSPTPLALRGAVPHHLFRRRS